METYLASKDFVAAKFQVDRPNPQKGVKQYVAGEQIKGQTKLNFGGHRMFVSADGFVIPQDCITTKPKNPPKPKAMKKYRFKKDTTVMTYVPPGSKMKSNPVTFKANVVELGEEITNTLNSEPPSFIVMKVPGGEVRVPFGGRAESPVEEYNPPVSREVSTKISKGNIALYTGIGAGIGAAGGAVVGIFFKNKPLLYGGIGAAIGGVAVLGYCLVQNRSK